MDKPRPVGFPVSGVRDTASEKPGTAKQEHAPHWMLKLARSDDPTTSDGMVYGGQTFYDREIKVAYVNVQTARALQRRGLVAFGQWWPDEGTELTLTEVPS